MLCPRAVLLEQKLAMGAVHLRIPLFLTKEAAGRRGRLARHLNVHAALPAGSYWNIRCFPGTGGHFVKVCLAAASHVYAYMFRLLVSEMGAKALF